MKKNVFFGFLFVVFAVVSCKSGTNNEDQTGKVVPIEKDSTELVTDSVELVEQTVRTNCLCQIRCC